MTSAGAAWSARRSARAAARSRSVSEYSRSVMGSPRLCGAPGRPVRVSASALAGEVLPRDFRVRAGLRGQAEDALGDDVEEDLRRAALDGVGPRAQVAVAGAARVVA